MRDVQAGGVGAGVVRIDTTNPPETFGTATFGPAGEENLLTIVEALSPPSARTCADYDLGRALDKVFAAYGPKEGQAVVIAAMARLLP